MGGLRLGGWGMMLRGRFRGEGIVYGYGYGHDYGCILVVRSLV